MIHLDITPDLEEDLKNRIIPLVVDLYDGRCIKLLFDTIDISNATDKLIDKGMQAALTNKKDVKSLMMKSSLNAALIGLGPYLIDMFWTGTPEQKPKPGRKDDLIEWYARFIVSQLMSIASGSDHVLHLIGGSLSTGLDNNEDTATIKVRGLYTEPVSRYTDDRNTEQEK